MVLVIVRPAWLTDSFALSGLCLESSRLPVALRVSWILWLPPAVIVTLPEPTTMVFLAVCLAEAVIAVSFPCSRVSTTVSTNLTLHDPLSEQLTCTLTVVPVTRTRPMAPLPGSGGGALV